MPHGSHVTPKDTQMADTQKIDTQKTETQNTETRKTDTQISALYAEMAPIAIFSKFFSTFFFHRKWKKSKSAKPVELTLRITHKL
jgi:heme/copper-type cytochrome/quinol oxidase subunit 3